MIATIIRVQFDDGTSGLCAALAWQVARVALCVRKGVVVVASCRPTYFNCDSRRSSLSLSANSCCWPLEHSALAGIVTTAFPAYR